MISSPSDPKILLSLEAEHIFYIEFSRASFFNAFLKMYCRGWRGTETANLDCTGNDAMLMGKDQHIFFLSTDQKDAVPVFSMKIRLARNSKYTRALWVGNPLSLGPADNGPDVRMVTCATCKELLLKKMYVFTS